MAINKLLKRTLALALVLCMMLTMLPAAYAAEEGQFTDVGTDHWAYSSIYEAVRRGLFYGMNDKEFAPSAKMDRGMFTVVLARMAKVEVDNTAETQFPDVPTGQYYTGAIAWAAENKILYGYTDGTVRPKQPVTREEAAAMLMRYVNAMGLELPKLEEKLDFTDGASIASYAKEAVQVMQMADIINGYTDGSFRPQADINRAEAAQLAVKFQDAAKKPAEPVKPITVTFVGEHCKVLVDGKEATKVTLDEGVNYLEFALVMENGYEIYETAASTGTLANMGSSYILGQMTGDTTVTLTTGFVKHTVTFDSCNGEEPVSVKVVHGETVAKPTDPVKSEDTFQGWHTVDSEAWDFNAPVMQDMTLYAFWLNDSYVAATIYLDGVAGSDTNDGLTPETAVKTFGKAQALMPAKVRDGIIYITNTVTVTSDETWSTGTRDCKVMRAPNCDANMVNVTAGTLTLQNITIDGNRENIVLGTKAIGHLLWITGQGAMVINDGTVIQNSFHFKGQGGAMYIEKGGKVTMNGGEIINNEAGYTGGAIGMTGNSTDPTLGATFIMNGGKISGNASGSLGGAIAASSGYLFLELNGGEISGNITKSATSAAVYHGSKYGYLKVTGGTVQDNVYATGAPSLGLYASYFAGDIAPAENGNLTLSDPVGNSIANNTSGKLNFLNTSTGLKYLNGKLNVSMKNLFVGAVVLAGAGDYKLTQEDLDKVAVTNDIEGAYQIVLDEDLNQIILGEIPTNDVIVYLNGASGKDENDGLTAKTAVKTFAKAKEILKARVDAMENIPEDANFVISLVNKVTITEDMTLTFADFGEYADRCMVRRDASYGSGQMFVVNGYKVTLEDIVIDGNLAFVKNNSTSMFSMNSGAVVTVNPGTEIRNYKSTGMGSLFYLNADKKNGNTQLIFNGGYIHDIQGGSGAIALLWGSSITGGYGTECIVNDILVENCTCVAGMFNVYTEGAVTFNGGIMRSNTATSAGTIAALRGDGKNRMIIVNAPAEGVTMELEGDIFLMNAKSDDNGNLSVIEDCVLYLGGALQNKLGITASMSMRKVPVAAGYGYTLSEADLENLFMTSGDALKLDKANNQIVITKTMN